MTKRVVVSALCCALWVLTTGCGDECVDAFDCRSDNGQPDPGQEWVCTADGECEQRPVEQPPEEDAGTDAGMDMDAGTDAGMDMDAGTDAGMDMDAGTDAGSMGVPKGEACVSSGDCMAGLRCEGEAGSTTCQAMHIAVTAVRDSDGGVTALVTRYDTPAPTALTADDMSSRYPRWGPGGTRIAFARGAVETGTNTGNEAGELVVRDLPLAEAEPTVLADGGTGSTESFRFMEWEPGSYIAYVRRSGASSSGVSVVPTDGGAVMSATETGAFPDWSPEGGTFAYSAATEGLLTSTVGGTPSPIANSGGSAEQPYYNRANNQLLFLRADESKPEGFNTALFLIPVTGGDVRTIADFTSETETGGTVDSYVANPAWAPDGTWAAYVRAYYSNPTGGTPVLCGSPSATLCPTRPGNIIFLRRINPETGEPTAPEVSFVEGATLPSFSPDGRFIAYIQGGELYVQEIDPETGAKEGSVIHHESDTYTVQTSAGDDHRPRWQPK